MISLHPLASVKEARQLLYSVPWHRDRTASLGDEGTCPTLDARDYSQCVSLRVF